MSTNPSNNLSAPGQKQVASNVDLSGHEIVSVINGPTWVGVTTQQIADLAVEPEVSTLTLTGSTSGTTVVQATAIASGTITVPAATDTLVGKATTDTLTNKTLTSPVINGATGTGGSYTGAITAKSGTATPAAASAVASFVMGSAGVGIYWGTGSPNTALTAAKGSVYFATDGSSTSTRMFVNSDGSTAWVAVTTAS